MWEDDQKKAEQENLRNPKNRFLGLFCHAKEVDNSWGCGWSFTTGVVIFSIIIGFGSLADIYYIAKNNILSGGTVTGLYKFLMILKIISDFISFIGIGISCFAVSKENLTYSIVAYYVIVLSFLLNTIFIIGTLIAIFYYFSIIGVFLIPWCALEFGLLLFCWILFANQVYLGRKRQKQALNQGV